MKAELRETNISNLKVEGGQKFAGFSDVKLYANSNPDKHLEIYEDLNQNYIIQSNKISICKKRLVQYHNSQSKSNSKLVHAFLVQDSSVEKINNSTNEELNTLLNNIENDKKEEIMKLLFQNKDNLKNIIDNLSIEGKSQVFEHLLKDQENSSAISSNIASININILKQYKRELFEKINNKETTETDIQNWLDENQSRRLIFGLEFTNHTSQGTDSAGKRFDFLVGLGEVDKKRIIIELKSPNDYAFETKDKTNKNDGFSSEYHLSDEISRAIPQVLSYRAELESGQEDSEMWQKLGCAKAPIDGCIIVIGQNKDNNAVWKRNFKNLRHSFGKTLEIMTYTDLIQKMETTIKNLESNLK